MPDCAVSCEGTDLSFPAGQMLDFCWSCQAGCLSGVLAGGVSTFCEVGEAIWGERASCEDMKYAHWLA